MISNVKVKKYIKKNRIKSESFRNNDYNMNKGSYFNLNIYSFKKIYYYTL